MDLNVAVANDCANTQQRCIKISRKHYVGIKLESSDQECIFYVA